MKRENILRRNGKVIGAKHRAVCLMVVLSCILLLCGCGEAQVEEEQLILIEPGQADIEYTLAVASIGDVEKTKRIRCEYQELSGMDLAFTTSGKEIKKVYVKAGDTVTKGQLLAELDIGDVDAEIRDLEYKIARNSLLLSYVDEDENYDISSMWHSYVYNSTHSEERKEALEESVAKLQQQNEYIREDYRDAIAMDTLELKQIQEEIAQSFLYAGMDGMISYVKTDLEGTIAEADEKVISIIDGTEGIFVVEDTECADYFTEGEAVDYTIISGVAAGTYQLLPYKMDEWTDELQFALADESDGGAIQVGNNGNIIIVIERREQVINIPSNAVHTADGKNYVYVVGEGNVREVKWIETGLYGDDSVEITSGLAEGEKVIVR